MTRKTLVEEHPSIRPTEDDQQKLVGEDVEASLLVSTGRIYPRSGGSYPRLTFAVRTLHLTNAPAVNPHSFTGSSKDFS